MTDVLNCILSIVLSVVLLLGAHAVGWRGDFVALGAWILGSIGTGIIAVALGWGKREGGSST